MCLGIEAIHVDFSLLISCEDAKSLSGPVQNYISAWSYWEQRFFLLSVGFVETSSGSLYWDDFPLMAAPSILPDRSVKVLVFISLMLLQLVVRGMPSLWNPSLQRVVCWTQLNTLKRNTEFITLEINLRVFSRCWSLLMDCMVALTWMFMVANVPFFLSCASSYIPGSDCLGKEEILGRCSNSSAKAGNVVKHGTWDYCRISLVVCRRGENHPAPIILDISWS